MNHKWEKLKLRDCSTIIDSKNKGVLSLCNSNQPFAEVIFFDTDCFCGCFMITFTVCKCGDLIDAIKNNNNAILTITRRCNNYIESVNLEGTLEIIDDNDNCCCKKKGDCFKTIRLNVDKISGKRFFKC